MPLPEGAWNAWLHSSMGFRLDAATDGSSVADIFVPVVVLALVVTIAFAWPPLVARGRGEGMLRLSRPAAGFGKAPSPIGTSSGSFPRPTAPAGAARFFALY